MDNVGTGSCKAVTISNWTWAFTSSGSTVAISDWTWAFANSGSTVAISNWTWAFASNGSTVAISWSWAFTVDNRTVASFYWSGVFADSYKAMATSYKSGTPAGSDRIDTIWICCLLDKGFCRQLQDNSKRLWVQGLWRKQYSFPEQMVRSYCKEVVVVQVGDRVCRQLGAISWVRQWCNPQWGAENPPFAGRGSVAFDCFCVVPVYDGYQPGGVAKRSTYYAALPSIPPGAGTVAEATKQLRQWIQWRARVQQLHAGEPDPTLLVKGLDHLAGKILAKNPKCLFRVTTFRERYGVDYGRSAMVVSQLAQMLRAELELLTYSGYGEEAAKEETDPRKKAKLNKALAKEAAKAKATPSSSSVPTASNVSAQVTDKPCWTFGKEAGRMQIWGSLQISTRYGKTGEWKVP